MKHSTKAETDRYFAHKERRAFVHAIILFIIASAIALWLFSCNPSRNGCKATKKMSGYSYIDYPEELPYILRDSGKVDGLEHRVSGDTLYFSFNNWKR